jgi:uncharacterized membrane protein YfcA
MLNRPRQQNPTEKPFFSDFHYYLGVFEGSFLLKALDKLLETAPAAFKLAFLACVNLKIMELEIDQAAKQGRPPQTREHYKNAALAFTSAVTTSLLASTLESSFGFGAAPALMIGSKLLVDQIKTQSTQARETTVSQTVSRYYNNLASWWHKGPTEPPRAAPANPRNPVRSFTV